MGMDVYGLKPKTSKGEYFRNNVWWWHPLWDYCTYISPELTSKVQDGHSNSGDGLNAVDSRKLGFAIQDSVENGKAEEYVNEYYEVIHQLPDEKCFCVKKNIFEAFTVSGPIPFPVEVGDKEPNPECQTCKGTGMQRNWNSNYHINVTNIQQFSEFLIDCGGFQIC